MDEQDQARNQFSPREPADAGSEETANDEPEATPEAANDEPEATPEAADDEREATPETADDEREAAREALREASRAATDAANKAAVAAREMGKELRGSTAGALEEIRTAAIAAGTRAQAVASDVIGRAREESARIREDVASMRAEAPSTPDQPGEAGAPPASTGAPPASTGAPPADTAAGPPDTATTPAETGPGAKDATPAAARYGLPTPPVEPRPTPPAPPRSPNSQHPPEESSTGFDANLAAALCYVFAPITGPLFYIIEKKSQFVRFHAMQAILFAAAAIITLSVLLFLIWVPLLGRFMFSMAGLGYIVVWLLVMWKALNYNEFRLPFIGDVAKSQVNPDAGTT